MANSNKKDHSLAFSDKGVLKHPPKAPEKGSMPSVGVNQSATWPVSAVAGLGIGDMLKK